MILSRSRIAPAFLTAVIGFTCLLSFLVANFAIGAESGKILVLPFQVAPGADEKETSELQRARRQETQSHDRSSWRTLQHRIEKSHGRDFSRGGRHRQVTKKRALWPRNQELIWSFTDFSPEMIRVIR